MLVELQVTTAQKRVSYQAIAYSLRKNSGFISRFRIRVSL